jgi:spore coat polysaccharide biosynthesis protein SpsF (cytidylyltransferase family)
MMSDLYKYLQEQDPNDFRAQYEQDRKAQYEYEYYLYMKRMHDLKEILNLYTECWKQILKK